MMKVQALVIGGQGQMEKCPFTWRTVCPILFLTLDIGLKMASCTEHGRPLLSQRVVGGKNSILSKFPWTVSLRYNNEHSCGASLISKTWIITAAHCVDGINTKKLSVMMGSQNLTSPSTSQVVIDVKTVLIHPIFKGDGTSGDLALMELAAPINFTKNILPICLPSPGQDFPDGTMCTLTGWGYTAENVKLREPFPLQEVDLPLINAPACEDMLLAKYKGTYTGGSIHTDMICAGYSNEAKDACQGDSGGPLACQLGDTWLLVGIVSWGYGCATPGVPGIYTKISNFTSWIIENSDLHDTCIPQTMDDSTTLESETFSTPETTWAETFSTPKTTWAETFSTQKTTRAETFSTPKPEQTAQSVSLIQQSTTDGANLRSSMQLSLLILSSIITKVWDIL